MTTAATQNTSSWCQRKRGACELSVYCIQFLDWSTQQIVEVVSTSTYVGTVIDVNLNYKYVQRLFCCGFFLCRRTGSLDDVQIFD